jgi:hypothetical protein
MKKKIKKNKKKKKRKRKEEGATLGKMKKTKIGVHEAIRDQKLALTDDEKLKRKA